MRALVDSVKTFENLHDWQEWLESRKIVLQKKNFISFFILVVKIESNSLKKAPCMFYCVCVLGC